MRLLLDTHIALWVFAGDKKVDSVREVILSDDNEVFVSVVSLWELAIKVGIGKINLDLPEIRWAIVESGFSELAIKGEHTESLLNLPPYHKDPFDRLLIAQAITEPMRLITADNKLQQYSDMVWIV